MTVRHGGRFFNEPGSAYGFAALVRSVWRSALCPQRYTVVMFLAYNGPEFIAAEVQEWLKQNGSTPHFIDPGCPWQNGFLESFHGKLRDELLDREVFVSVAEAQACLETHQHWYNKGRPHSSLHYVFPAAFAKSWRQAQQKQEAIEPPD